MSEPRNGVDDVIRSYHEGITRELAAVRADVEGSVADGEPADVGASVERVVTQIVGLLVAEEQYVLPLVREHAADGDAAADAQFGLHRDLEHQLRRLEDLELTSELAAPVLAGVVERFDALTTTLQNDLLPPVVAAIPAERSVELGDEVLGAIEVAPTRPRGLAPRNPELGKLVAYGQGFLDRWRDAWSGRGRGTDDVDDVAAGERP